jgi:hypothetical protein
MLSAPARGQVEQRVVRERRRDQLHPVRRVVIAAADGDRHGNRSRTFTKMVKVPSRPESHRSRSNVRSAARGGDDEADASLNG